MQILYIKYLYKCIGKNNLFFCVLLGWGGFIACNFDIILKRGTLIFYFFYVPRQNFPSPLAYILDGPSFEDRKVQCYIGPMIYNVNSEQLCVDTDGHCVNMLIFQRENFEF